MWSYRLGTFNDFHWGFKPVLSLRKPLSFSTCFGEEKEINVYLFSPTRPEDERNDSIVKKVKLKRMG